MIANRRFTTRLINSIGVFALAIHLKSMTVVFHVTQFQFHDSQGTSFSIKVVFQSQKPQAETSVGWKEFSLCYNRLSAFFSKSLVSAMIILGLIALHIS